MLKVDLTAVKLKNRQKKLKIEQKKSQFNKINYDENIISMLSIFGENENTVRFLQ